MKRERLPKTRNSVTHRVKLIEYDKNVYFIIGLYPDGRPGEVFIQIDQEGSELGGVYDSIGIAFSMLLQSSWSVRALAKKFAHLRFEPAGMTDNPKLTPAKSVVDYLVRYLESEEFKEAARHATTTPSEPTQEKQDD